GFRAACDSTRRPGTLRSSRERRAAPYRRGRPGSPGCGGGIHGWGLRSRTAGSSRYHSSSLSGSRPVQAFQGGLQVAPRRRFEAGAEEIGVVDAGAGQERGEELPPLATEQEAGHPVVLLADLLLVVREARRIGAEDGEVDVDHE